MKVNKLKEAEIGQEDVREYLDYDLETGIFIRKKKVRGATIGSVAGCLSGGYRVISVKGNIYYAHRLAWLYMFGRWPELQIDHINHNRDDNRLKNLRQVSALENQKNRSLSHNNSSGKSGVRWCSQMNKWKATIDHKREKYHLGYFDCLASAISSRNDAENKFGFHSLHGA